MKLTTSSAKTKLLQDLLLLAFDTDNLNCAVLEMAKLLSAGGFGYDDALFQRDLLHQ